MFIFIPLIYIFVEAIKNNAQLWRLELKNRGKLN